MINIPNLLSLSRIIVIAPLMVYFIIDRNPIVVVSLGVIAIITDVIDGHLARLWKQESVSGAFLDATADTVIIASLVFPFAYLGLLSWPMVAFFAAHRFTRGFSSSYFNIYGKGGLYNPRYMKATAYIPTIHILLLPIAINLYGQEFTDIATWTIFISTYIALLAGIGYGMTQLKKGKLKLSHKTYKTL
jgi:cardiolipin synthase (CMP-forming)